MLIKYILYAGILVLVSSNNALALGVDFFYGHWHAETNNFKSEFVIDRQVVDSGKISIKISDSESGMLLPQTFIADFSYAYTSDGLYPYISISIESNTLDGEYYAQTIYVIPGYVEKEGLQLLGFYELTYFDDKQKETVKSKSKIVTFRKD